MTENLWTNSQMRVNEIRKLYDAGFSVCSHVEDVRSHFGCRRAGSLLSVLRLGSFWLCIKVDLVF